MVKLEASLAEMERELTRAEAAHMRERRELLDREAAAVADQERFRSRTILLQGEVGGLSFLLRRNVGCRRCFSCGREVEMYPLALCRGRTKSASGVAPSCSRARCVASLCCRFL